MVSRLYFISSSSSTTPSYSHYMRIYFLDYLHHPLLDCLRSSFQFADTHTHSHNCRFMDAGLNDLRLAFSYTFIYPPSPYACIHNNTRSVFVYESAWYQNLCAPYRRLLRLTDHTFPSSQTITIWWQRARREFIDCKQFCTVVHKHNTQFEVSFRTLYIPFGEAFQVPTPSEYDCHSLTHTIRSGFDTLFVYINDILARASHQSPTMITMTMATTSTE